MLVHAFPIIMEEKRRMAFLYRQDLVSLPRNVSATPYFFLCSLSLSTQPLVTLVHMCMMCSKWPAH